MKDKSIKRIENKRRKMAALVQISNLNEHDRVSKKQHNDCVDTEPKMKKLKTTNEPVELGPSGKPKLKGAELKELKKMLRERTTKLRLEPFFRLRDMGQRASITEELEQRVPLFLSDVQHLIMYSQIGHSTPYVPTRWCGLDKFNRLTTTCVLIIENVSLYQYTTHESLFPFMRENFEFKLEILCPNACKNDVVKTLSMVPLTSIQMRKYCNEFGTLEDAVLKSNEVFDMVRNLFPIAEPTMQGAFTEVPPTDRFSRTQLLLSGWQMIEENYPLPIKGLMEHKYPEYVLTKDTYKSVSAFSKMYGIDCEMCMTTTGDLELTRVSVVDENLDVFYDTLVKPYNRITNYLTRFSGITPFMMRGIRTRLRDVQNTLRRLLPADAILVGQSLGNDLHALKMMHPYVIDTSVIYNLTGERARKTKLKTLTEEFLSEKIQEGTDGHCSTEDSIASLKLVQLKLRKNLYFGDAVMGNIQTDIRKYPELGTFNYATSVLRQVITKRENTVSIIGLNDIAFQYKYYVHKDTTFESERINYSSEDSCEGVIQKLVQSANTTNLSIGHVKIQDSEFKGTEIFQNIDKWVGQVHEKITKPGLILVILTGSGASNGVCFIQLKKDPIHQRS